MTDFRGTLSCNGNGVCDYTPSDSEMSELSRLSNSYSVTDTNFDGTLVSYPNGVMKYSHSEKEIVYLVKNGDLTSLQNMVSMGYDVNLFHGLSVGFGPSLCALAFFQSDFEIFKLFLDNTSDVNLGFVSSEIALFPGSLGYIKLIVKRIGLFKPDVLKYASNFENLSVIRETLEYMSDYGADISYLFNIYSTPREISLLLDMGAYVNNKTIGLNSKFSSGLVNEYVSIFELYSRGYEFMCKFHPSGLDYCEWEEAMFVVLSAF
jgi:hypothetical protein